MEEKLSMFVFMDSPWREYKSRESPDGVVVEVLDVRILHLANLQCGRQRKDIQGQGEDWTMFCAGRKEKPLESVVW